MGSRLNYQPYIAKAQEIQKEKGIPASVTLAQMILESSSDHPTGMSTLARSANNLFGIKANSSWNGQTYTALTNEEVNGTLRVQQAMFRKYNSPEDSIEDYANLITNQHYILYTSKATSPEAYAQALQNAGYATDSSYADKLIKIMQDNNLKQYDNYQTGYTVDRTTDMDNVTQKEDKDSLMTNIVSIVITILIFLIMIFLLFTAFKQI